MSTAAINTRLVRIEDVIQKQLAATEKMVERAESLSLLGEIASKLMAIESALAGWNKKAEQSGKSQTNADQLAKRIKSAKKARQKEEQAEETVAGQQRKGRYSGKEDKKGGVDFGDLASGASFAINAAEFVGTMQKDEAAAQTQEKAAEQAAAEQAASEQVAAEQAASGTAGAAAGAAEAGAGAGGAGAAGGQAPFNMDEFMTSAQEVSTLYSGFMKDNAGIANQISTYLPVIDSMFDGLNKGIAAYNKWQELQKIATTIVTFAMQLQQLAALGLRGAWTALTTAMKANPMIFIVTLLLAVGAALIHLWKTNDTFALNFLKIWHNILGFFDQVAIFFWTIAEALLQPFVLWAKTIGHIYDGVINGILGGINKVLGVINKISGSDFKIDLEFSMEKFAEDMLAGAQDKKQNAILRAQRNRAKWDLEEASFLDKRAAEKAAKELEAEEKAPNTPVYTPSPAPIQISGGRLDEVGRVNDTVDISSEDLKTMRELAELKSIQNFVTLTPSVNVQTGDIRNGMDVSSMVQAITASLQEEIAASAEGVYA
jgi:hypothetical protein